MTNSHLHLIRTLFFKTLLAWSQLIEKHNKNTFDVTKFHRPGGLNNRNLFLTVLEAEKSKIEVPVDKDLGQVSFWLAEDHFLAVSSWYFPLCMWVERDLSLPPLVRPSVLSDEDLGLLTSFHLNYLPKALFPNMVMLEIRASTKEFGGWDIIQSRVTLIKKMR